MFTSADNRLLSQDELCMLSSTSLTRLFFVQILSPMCSCTMAALNNRLFSVYIKKAIPPPIATYSRDVFMFLSLSMIPISHQ